VKTALSRAGIAPDELDHINAHAPGTTCDDEWEAKALKNALGDFPVPVVAMKSFFGNLGTGSSAVEMIASLLALADGCRPGTLNHDETDPDCPVLVARDSGKVQKPCVLKTACTDRGQCVAMVLKRWEA
jgi:3-oxoacyl-[acyl-carrier-protein] synthase II